jgi:Na+-translocating ferredoxin:NAD+ oxidoreductase RnfD subunit
MPLIVAWVGGFFIQALIRNWVFGTSWTGGLVPMTGVAFLLFTFYMISDPGTTPSKPINQMVFGAGVAIAYAVLLMVHVAFGLFFALVCVCALRGLGLHASSLYRARVQIDVQPSMAPEGASAMLREAEL